MMHRALLAGSLLAVALAGAASDALGQHLYISCTVSTPEDTAATVEFGLNIDALDGIKGRLQKIKRQLNKLGIEVEEPQILMCWSAC